MDITLSPVTFLALSNEVSLPHYDPLKPIAIVLLNSGEWRINGAQNKLVKGDIASYLSEDLLLKHSPKYQSEMSADVILLEHDLLEAFLNSYTPPTHHLQNATGLSSDKLGQQLIQTLKVSTQTINAEAVQPSLVQQAIAQALLLHLATTQPAMIDLLKRAIDCSFLDKTSLFLDARLDQSINLPMLAQYLQISVSTVKRKLANEGLSFTHLLRQKRVYKGANLLRSGRTHISAIAPLCGFSSAAQFSSAFKSIYGCTPKVFRRERRTP